jgi:prepilin-type N-terminal cleavage/methylation domain-containing protein/prepilin-type processing-associated H-X9-DG protein
MAGDRTDRAVCAPGPTGRRAFTLIELLVVIAIIAILMAVLMPALSTAKRIASSAACLGNHRSLLAGWIMYADDNDGVLMCNGACYETDTDKSAWVHRPKTAAGADAPVAAVLDEDRFRGIRAGTMWKYVKDVGVYHCPGDNRRNTRRPPRDCWRSYSISYAFGVIDDRRRGTWDQGFRYYNRMPEVKNAALYYVFVEEEHNGSQYGENEGGWHLPFLGAQNRIDNSSSWAFYDPLASYHNKSSTFGFADGHADRIKWMDKRTLEFIRTNAEAPGVHSGILTPSPDNRDLKWLIEHFIARDRIR